ncbi:hypothetical protein EDB19DRAFT_1701363 [Suillus lakei]|nr:hypothetical protein EDB19DRAFT_1701363 [Suillus lakei]
MLSSKLVIERGTPLQLSMDELGSYRLCSSALFELFTLSTCGSSGSGSSSEVAEFITTDITGALTKNKQTVTEMYVVDGNIHADNPPSAISPMVREVLEIGTVLRCLRMASAKLVNRSIIWH